MSTVEQEFYTVDELAVLLRLVDDDGKPVRQSIYWMRHRGEAPPAIRIGGRRARLLFRRADVEAWLADRAEPAAQAG